MPYRLIIQVSLVLPPFYVRSTHLSSVSEAAGLDGLQTEVGELKGVPESVSLELSS